MNGRYLSKFLYGWLRVCFTSCLAVVLVLTTIALSPAKADAIPGRAQDQLQLLQKLMNSPLEVDGSLTPINSYSGTGLYPYTSGPDKPDFSLMSNSKRPFQVEGQERSTEVTDVGFWLNLGKDDWIWGKAITDVDVAIEINEELVATAHSDPVSGEWNIDHPIDINPVDEVTVTAGAGTDPVVIPIPDPLFVQADSLTDEVRGQVGGRSEDWVQVHPHWGDPGEETTTDIYGIFSVTFGDIPYGGEGNLYYNFDQDGTSVDMNVYFRTPDLVLRVHSDYDWIEGFYEPGHMVSLTVLESDKETVKAMTDVSTGPVEEWGGTSGFVTWREDVDWYPEQPDIQPGDWVQGVVDYSSPYTAEVQIGLTEGTVDVDSDSISGTLDADWLLPDPVDITCQIWSEDSPEEKYDQITPDGDDEYNCSWSSEYDIVPGEHVQVIYFDEMHQILREFHEPAAYLQIEKYYIGDGSPGVGGNAAFWVQYQNQGDLTAESVTITDTLIGMTYLSDTSGFPTSVLPGNQEVIWDLGSVEPGDWVGFVVVTTVEGAVDEPWSNTVEITTPSPDYPPDTDKTSTQEGTIAGNDTHLDVGKDTWTGNPAPGEKYIYQINVCNHGSTGSSTVTVTDTYPGATSLVEWWSPHEGWYEIDQFDHTLELGIDCVSPNTCAQVRLVMLVDETALPGDELINHVEIAADNDMETEDNFAEVHHNVGEPYVDLALWQDWHWGSLVPGGEYRYGITFRNDGNVAVSGPIKVTATLPDGVGFLDWDYWEEDWAIPEPIFADHTITWKIHDMLPGTQGTIELLLFTDAGMTPGTILEHLAEIEIQDGEKDTENNSHKLIEMVNDHGPNLRIWKYGWEQGDHVGYHIHVENIGDETVSDVTIIDDYSDLLQLEGGVNVGYDQPWEWHDDDPEAGAFTVILDRLEPGWGADMEYNMLILDAEPLEPGIIFENTAEIYPMDGDTNLADNSTTWVMGTGPDLFVKKMLEEGTFEPGEQVTYRLMFGNMHNENAWWWDMAGHIVLTDMLPDGMHFVSSYLHHCGEEVWDGIETTTRGQELTWSLYPEGSDFCYELLLTAEIDSEVDFMNPLINQAMVESSMPEVDIDPFPENNTDTYDPERPVLTIFMPLIIR